MSLEAYFPEKLSTRAKLKQDKYLDFIMEIKIDHLGNIKKFIAQVNEYLDDD